MKDWKNVKFNTILLLIMFSSISFIVNQNTRNYDSSIITNEPFSSPLFDDELDSFKPLGFSYTPIESVSNTGDDFTINDDITVSHSFSLNLDSSNGRSSSFEIINPSGYSNTSMNYDMTITTAKDDLNVRVDNTGEAHTIGFFSWAYAQAFEVTWDYAVFYGADVYITGAAINNDELDIFLVKASGPTGPPNMADIRSSTLSGPFTSSNPITGGFDYYDFEDVVIESGKYYIVTNMSVMDGGSFSWIGYKGTSNSDTYRHSPSGWTLIISPVQDCCLKVELMESDINGDPITFSNPTSINLQDGGVPITSRFQTINRIGQHNLTADSSHSYELFFNNSYSFSTSYISTATYQAQNSTFGEYNIHWTLDWSVNYASLSPYSNLIREHHLITPSDWNTSVISTLLNNSVVTTSTKDVTGYLIDLDLLAQGNSIFEADIKLETMSPNYIYESLITNGTVASSEFNLGYWTNNETHATGYNGSEIDFDIFIKDNLLNNINDGELNFSIYNEAGIIQERKENLYSNLTFTDNTNYTLLLSSQISSGHYSSNTFFDPSLYGTDTPGYWTITFLWTNGTEVGIFSKKISVNAKTSSSFEWEQENNPGIWNNDSNIVVNYIGNDYLNVRSQYFSQSEPYFEGEGIYISQAEVFYNTSWMTSSSLTYNNPYYEETILINGPCGEQHITLHAGGDFLSSFTKEIKLLITNQFSLETSITDYYLNYTNSIEMKFQLKDITNAGANIFPDAINISLNSVLLSTEDFVNYTESNDIIIGINTGELNLAPGEHEVVFSVSKHHYIDTEKSPSTSVIVFIHIEEIQNLVEVLSSSPSVYYNNQTTLQFQIIDTNHTTQVKGAIVSFKADIEEVELITQYEDDGVYFLVLRIYEPEVASMNIFVNITKTGYKSLINYHLGTVNILPTDTETPTETPTLPPTSPLPIALIVILGIIVLSGISFTIYWYLRKYLNRRRIAKSEQLERARSLFQSVFMIKKILVIHNLTSLPIIEIDIHESEGVDNALISGVLEAISTIGTEIMGAPTGIKKIEYIGFEVTRATSGIFTVYLFADSGLSMEIIEGVHKISKWFDLFFNYQIEEWDGSLELFNQYMPTIMEQIVCDLYLWLLYPLEIEPLEETVIKHLSHLGKQIYQMIEEHGKATTIYLIDTLEEFEKEEIIVQVLKMVNNNHLKTNISD